MSTGKSGMKTCPLPWCFVPSGCRKVKPAGPSFFATVLGTALWEPPLRGAGL